MGDKKQSLDLEGWLDKLALHIPPLKAFSMRDPGVARFEPERVESMAHLRTLIDAYFRVMFEGLEHLPAEGPVLLVGNHGRTGLDAFVFAAVASERFGRPVRPLTDRIFFRVPKLRDWIAGFGGVPGTRENAVQLLQDGNLVVVYPGGNDEVMKPAHEAYQLSWGDRVGFIKVAQAAGAPIVPVAGIGVEELYHNLPGWDAYEMSPLARWLEDTVGRRYRAMPPIAGLGPLPSPVQLTFALGEMIPVHQVASDDESGQLELQRRVQSSLKRLIREGLARRGEHTP